MNAETVVTRRSYWIGVSGIAISWVAAAIINSCMNALNTRGFSGEELLYFRSVPCMIVAFIVIQSSVLRMNALGHKASVVVAASSVLFYEAMAEWGKVNPVIVLIALMPIVNIYLARRDGKNISSLTYACVLLIIGGVTWALDPFSEPFSRSGLVLALACVVVSAVGFDMWSKTDKTVTLWHKGFWLGVYVIIFAVLVMGARHMLHSFTGNTVIPIYVELAKYSDPIVQKYLWWFAIFATVYIYSSVLPFTETGKMDVVHASIMTQGATPASLVGSWLIVEERLESWQIPGIICALLGATLVTVQLIRAPVVTPATR